MHDDHVLQHGIDVAPMADGMIDNPLHEDDGGAKLERSPTCICHWYTLVVVAKNRCVPQNDFLYP